MMYEKRNSPKISDTSANQPNSKIGLTSSILLQVICLFSLTFHSYAQPLAYNKDKFVGNVIRDGNNIESIFDDYWNQVTPENAGKWGSVEPVRDTYNWTQLDNIYNYALNHEFPYRHHTLVWGNQEPGWISGLDSAEQYDEVVEWFTLVGQKYPDADFCDVVNEPLHDPPSYKNALGGDGETGWDWVIKAFELARQYLSTNTKLHLNEYSVINSNTSNANYIEIINLLKERNLIDGIGVQGHNFEVNGGASVSTLVNNLTNLANTGLPIYITEFDINEADDNVQLEKYQTIFPPIYEHQGVVGITLWGYIQYRIWQTNAYLLDDRYAERPAMEWLRTYLEAPYRPVLISPIGTTGELRDPLMVWHSSETATSYHLQVATSGIFTNIVVDSITVTADTTLRLSPLEAYTRYFWRVSAINELGESPFSPHEYFDTGEQTSDLEVLDGYPNEFSISQNYPNPFNPTTTIEFAVPFNTEVSIKLYDVLGKEVGDLVKGNYNQGHYKVNFDGTGLTSGIYFYRLEAEGFVSTKKLTILK